MSVLTYLSGISSSLIFHDDNNSVDRSLNCIKSRLRTAPFANDIISIDEFGSYTRDTMLPRSVDGNADIDIMVVFRNELGLKPQTLLTKIKTHVLDKYKRSEVYQDFPTIVLDLNLIKYEIVPAIKNYWRQLQIPSKEGYNDWIATNPANTKRIVDYAKSCYPGKILPLIRLMKAWNVKNGKPFDTYALEEQISQMNYYYCSNLKDCFYTCVDNLWLPMFPAYKNSKLQRLKQIVANTKQYEANGQYLLAENEIKKAFY